MTDEFAKGREAEMDDRELYEQKRRAQLDEWAAEIKELKAKASKASADARLELDRRVGALQRHVAQGRTLLSELANESADAWEEARERVDSAWSELEAGAKAAVKELQE